MPTSDTVDAPRVLPRPEHPVSRKDIDRNALKVLYRLHRAGYRSYVVGGGVRDLMLRQRPKDFDIATNARPKEIRRLFNNSRIIGRRFRLVHVFFREGIIEVSTFRRDPDPDQQRGGPDDPLITDDNIFGTAAEDAFRRDFTINALFYDIADYSVIDYIGGIDDLEQEIVRTIGDPEVRLQEDPVRMVRACEFAGRLGFGIEEGTQRAIHALARQIDRGAPSRLTEELVQLLRSGSAGPAMQWMLDLDLLEHFLPEAKAMLERRTTADLGGMIPALDRAMAEGREHSDAAVIGALLLPEVIRRARQRSRGRTSDLKTGAFRDVVEEVLEPFARRFRLSRDRSEGTRQALIGHHKMRTCNWEKAAARVQFANRPYFPDALALFQLEVDNTGRGGEELRRWQQASRHRRTDGEGKRSKKRRRKGRRRRRRR